MNTRDAIIENQKIKINMLAFKLSLLARDADRSDIDTGFCTNINFSPAKSTKTNESPF